jgi:hypothetical protein
VVCFVAAIAPLLPFLCAGSWPACFFVLQDMPACVQGNASTCGALVAPAVEFNVLQHIKLLGSTVTAAWVAGINLLVVAL